MTPDSCSPLEPTLRENREGMTIQNAMVVIPDLIQLVSPYYVRELDQNVLASRLERIDLVLENKELTPALRKTITAARSRILEVMADQME